MNKLFFGTTAKNIIAIFIFLLCFGQYETTFAQSCLTLNSQTYFQNFTNQLPDGTAVPAGWSIAETGTGSNSNYVRSGTGSSATPDTYAYTGNSTTGGASLGEISSPDFQSRFGFCFVNNTGATITTLVVKYNGEQWRSGGPAYTAPSNGPADRLDFQYFSGAANAGDVVAWTDANALDFTSPINNEAAAAINRARPDDTVVIQSLINGINVPNGSSFSIRWVGINRVDGVTDVPDHAMAVDDVSISTVAPTASSLELRGKVTTGFNRPIANARVALTDANGITRYTLTNPLGNYVFNELEVGSYIVGVSSKRFSFTDSGRLLNLNESMQNVNFTADNF